MFAYELSSLTLSALGVYRRSHYGFLELENEEKAFQAKVAESLAKAREDSEEAEVLEGRRPERGAGEGGVAEGGEAVGVVVPMHRLGTITTLADRKMAGRIWRETEQLRQDRSRTEGDANFGGPCFELTFNN
ncbi:hypothetical protein VE00_04283 [Pseudogymnoascus sp. WSF 3629]|nr:hypothetical protein VE00_04283 [Pseudogymnoascus sp. WSF 3629]